MACRHRQNLQYMEIELFFMETDFVQNSQNMNTSLADLLDSRLQSKIIDAEDLLGRRIGELGSLILLILVFSACPSSRIFKRAQSSFLDGGSFSVLVDGSTVSANTYPIEILLTCRIFLSELSIEIDLNPPH